MTTAAFDTLKLARALRDADFTTAQAEGAAEAIAAAIQSDLATKADLMAVKSEMTGSIAEAKADILKWMFGTIGFQTIVILGAVFALAHASHP
jgi:hypothetical protein